MTRIAAYLVVAGLAAGSVHLASASSRLYRPGEVEILVNDVPQQRYAHNGRWYVEAIKGREYAIRLRNPYGVRVAVALSVDGLNTIDAQQTTAKGARKWVLEPYQTVTISGWQTSRTVARRFEFTNAGLNIFAYDEGNWFLLTWGDVSHLAPDGRTEGEDP